MGPGDPAVGAMGGETGQLPGQEVGPGVFGMPGIVDMGDYARYPMIEEATQRVTSPYEGFNANPVMNQAAQRYNDPGFQQANTQGLQNYAQSTAMQGLGGNQFGQQDVWNQAILQGRAGITPEQQATMDYAQQGMSANNPYDQRMHAAISGRNVGINASFDKSRANLENRFATMNQLGSPAFRSAMQDLESGRATQIGNTTADFNMAAANNDQSMRSQRFSDFSGAAKSASDQRQQNFTNLAGASGARMGGGTAAQGIRSDRLQGLGSTTSLDMQAKQQAEDVARGRLQDVTTAGNLGLSATRDREQGRSNRLNQLQSVQGQEYGQVRQRQQDQANIVDGLNKTQSTYDQSYANAMQQGKNNQDTGLQLAQGGLNSLGNPMGAAGTAMSGYGNAATAGGNIGTAGQNSLASALSSPGVQGAIGDVGNWIQDQFTDDDKYEAGQRGVNFRTQGTY